MEFKKENHCLLINATLPAGTHPELCLSEPPRDCCRREALGPSTAVFISLTSFPGS